MYSIIDVANIWKYYSALIVVVDNHSSRQPMESLLDSRICRTRQRDGSSSIPRSFLHRRHWSRRPRRCGPQYHRPMLVSSRSVHMQSATRRANLHKQYSNVQNILTLQVIKYQFYGVGHRGDWRSDALLYFRILNRQMSDCDVTVYKFSLILT